MRRFLLLYIDEQERERHYAEGLVLYDGSVYCNGFPAPRGQLWLSLLDFKNAMRDLPEIWSHEILELDKAQ